MQYFYPTKMQLHMVPPLQLLGYLNTFPSARWQSFGGGGGNGTDLSSPSKAWQLPCQVLQKDALPRISTQPAPGLPEFPACHSACGSPRCVFLRYTSQPPLG